MTVGVDFYFPEQNLKHRERFEESGTHTTCGWKGEFFVSFHVVLRILAWM
jgi:uncharacterized protein (DUF427 family)